ncbi:glycosyltransferase family 2 protein [Nitrospinaceae bacterium]|nr:glycosyltransferase family 2 protein [Nitrospinaceae bacterium]
MRGKDWEYILVDDGSTDNSYKIAFDVIGNHPRCNILHYQNNQGRGYALRTGISASKGKYVITTESDLSWGSTIIQNLYEHLVLSKSDIVVASVFHKGGRFVNVPIFRRLLSRGGNWLMQRCFESCLTQFSGMTRGYRREVIQSMHLEEKDKEIHLEIISKAEALGFLISEIPATIQWNKKRVERGEKKLSMLRYVISHLMNSLNQGSLKFFFFSSLMLFLTGVGFVAFGTINKLFFITDQPFPYMVNYGLVLLLMSLICTLFGGMTIQLRYMGKNLIHLQSQVKALHKDQKIAVEKNREKDDG